MCTWFEAKIFQKRNIFLLGVARYEIGLQVLHKFHMNFSGASIYHLSLTSSNLSTHEFCPNDQQISGTWHYRLTMGEDNQNRILKVFKMVANQQTACSESLPIFFAKEKRPHSDGSQRSELPLKISQSQVSSGFKWQYSRTDKNDSFHLFGSLNLGEVLVQQSSVKRRSNDRNPLAQNESWMIKKARKRYILHHWFDKKCLTY